MMKLDNMVIGLAGDAAAASLLERWEHSEGSLKFCRASSNFVYVFENRGERFYLRFSFELERQEEQIRAELDFLAYLQNQHYPIAAPVLSLDGKVLEKVHAAEGTYYGVVFRSAAGVVLEDDLTAEQCRAWGRSLASLHQLSQAYRPSSVPRVSWKDILQEIDVILKRHPKEREAAAELSQLNDWLMTLPITEQNYGLIHYDFQLDNVFYEADTRSFVIIDFDDAVYSWYVQDIVNAIDDVVGDELGLEHPHAQAFLEGYGSILPLGGDKLSQFTDFRRFMNLQKFSSLLRSLEGCGDDVPEWVQEIKVKFVRVMDRMRRGFAR